MSGEPQGERRDRGEQDLTPEKALDYITKLGSDIAQSAKDTKAMLAIAERRGVNVDLADALKPFQPTGTAEVKLTELRADVDWLKTVLNQQGLKVTIEELQAEKSRS